MNRVEICGVYTAKLQVLTNVKLRELFVALQKGDAAVREKHSAWETCAWF